MAVIHAKPTEAAPLREAHIQDAVAQRCLRRLHHIVAVPNTTVFQWESDLVSVTKAGLVHETEIKISRSDFLAEMREERRSRCKWSRHQMLAHGSNTTPRGRLLKPNYFWFAVAPGVCEPDEIPEYAGLLRAAWVGDAWVGLTVERPAPRLHAEKVCDAMKEFLFRGVVYRYWDLRLRDGL